MFLILVTLFLPIPFCIGVPPSPLVVPRQNDAAFEINLESIIEHVYPNDSTLDTLAETVNKVVQKFEGLINGINSDGVTYLENLEKEKFSYILHSFNEPPCMEGNEIKYFKKSFITELGLLELPVRETLAELKDKVTEMKRSLEMERSILELKLTTCFLTESGQVCANGTSPAKLCFNDTCSPSQSIHSIQNIKNHESQSHRSTSSERIRLLSTECPDGRFKCLNGNCIHFRYACDGGRDCSDGSDEVFGCQRQCLGKRCRNLRCITEEQICNGVDDCGDGTDEENCLYTKDNCSISMNKYLCTNRQQCLELTQVCNGIEDCIDGSDEGVNCNRTSDCAQCFGAGGSCLPTPANALCLRKCPSDFALDLRTGVCTTPPLGSEISVIYETDSFTGIMEKLKLLFNRFSSGFTLLKKHMNFALTKTINKLNKCMQDNKGSLNSPFLIL